MRIVIAAGGTGGHLFPASVVKDRLEAKGHKVFLITDDRGKRFATGFKNIYEIMGGQWSGEGLARRVKTLIQLGIGCLQTCFHMIRIRPRAVIGMGGYISVPPVIVGALTFRRTVIFNADATLGNANILLKRFADRIAVAFPGTIGAPRGKKTVVVGLPMRDPIKAAAKLPYPAVGEKITITILGGSQGAQIFSDAIPEAIAALDRPVRIFHQVVADDVARVQKFYAEHKIEASVADFFTNPADLLRRSHIFIGRSGASTVYEAGLLGIPSIFVPIKHKDRQQYLNAEKLADAGGAIIIEQHDFNKESVLSALAKMLDKKTLESMAMSAKIFDADNDAGANIVKLLD